MSQVTQRVDLTFKANAGRHGWLRLTPAYSVRVVEKLLDEASGTRILDPFSGTGTTALCAASRGLEGLGVDINPFLLWLGRTKVRRFAPRTLRTAREYAERALEGLHRAPAPPAPPIHNIERWWHPEVLLWLRQLRGRLAPKSAPGMLLEVAFCRSVVALSGAAFDHPSMSFGEARDLSRDQCAEQFRGDVEHVIAGAAQRPAGSARFLRADARSLRALSGTYDRVITSPPYPNRMSYVRELRPYMYWTGRLEAAREAGELDWLAIGGTWGIATSRLAGWKRSGGVAPSGLDGILRRVRGAHPKNGPLLATYLDRYFADTESHLEALRPHVPRGGRLSYVVGNASFYGELVPAQDFYAELMERAGFIAPNIETLRKRNSKRELFEYVIHARG